MTNEQLTAYLQDESYLYTLNYEELKTLVMQYPYSANLRVLLLKKSHLEQNKDYDRNLQMASTYTTNRKHLYKTIRKLKSFKLVPQNVILGEDYLELTELSNIERLLAEKQVSEAANPAPTLESLSQDWKLEIDDIAFNSQGITAPVASVTPSVQNSDNQPISTPEDDELNFLIGNLVSEFNIPTPASAHVGIDAEHKTDTQQDTQLVNKRQIDFENFVENTTAPPSVLDSDFDNLEEENAKTDTTDAYEKSDDAIIEEEIRAFLSEEKYEEHQSDELEEVPHLALPHQHEDKLSIDSYPKSKGQNLSLLHELDKDGHHIVELSNLEENHYVPQPTLVSQHHIAELPYLINKQEQIPPPQPIEKQAEIEKNNLITSQTANIETKEALKPPRLELEIVNQTKAPIVENKTQKLDNTNKPSFTEWLSQFRLTPATPASPVNTTPTADIKQPKTTVSTPPPFEMLATEEVSRRISKKSMLALFEEDNEVPDNLFGLASAKEPVKPVVQVHFEEDEDDFDGDELLDEPDPSSKKKKKKREMHQLAVKSLIADTELVSETLADLLAWQGNTEKARDMYRKLILQFPEKSSYFATKIQKISN